MDKDQPNSDLPHTSAEMLEAISEATTDSIFFKDLEGRYQFVNSAFSKFIGYTAAEIIGKSDADLYPAETARQFINADRIVLASGMTRVFEGVAVGRDRAQLYMVTKGVLRNRAGEIVGLFGISHDMTSRQLVDEERAERLKEQAARVEAEASSRTKDGLLKALTKSEERYRSLLENANDIIYSHDLQGRYLSINRAGERVMGYSREEVLAGMNISQIVVPEHLELARQMTARKLVDSSPTVYEIDVLAKDGRRLTLEVSTRVSFRDGKPFEIEGIARDVTERKRAQAVLARQAENAAMRAEVSAATAAGGPVDEMLTRSMEAVVRRLDASVASLFSIDETAGELILRASSGQVLYPEINEVFQRNVSRVREEQNPLLINHEIRSTLENVEQNETITFAGYPLLVEGRIIGVLAALRKQFLFDDQFASLKIVADLIAQGVRRKRVEFSLIESEQRLALAQEAGNIGTFEWDIVSNRVVWTTQLETLFGLPEGGFGGTFDHWRERVHPDDLLRCETEIKNSVASGSETWLSEYRMFRGGNGELRWINVRARIFYSPEGKPLRMIGVNIDITEARRNEIDKDALSAQVELERERLEAIIGNIPGVVWEAWGKPDADSQRINFVSDYVEELLGYTVQEWLSTPNFWLTIVHQEDSEAAAEQSRREYESGEGGINEFRWVAKDGRVIWVQSQSVIIKDDDGRPIGMRGVTLDVTWRKEAEQRLERSQHLFRGIAEATPDILYLYDLIKDKDLYVNPRIEEVLGYPADVISRLLTGVPPGLIHPEDQRLIAQRNDRFERMASDQVLQTEYRVFAADGTYRLLSERTVVFARTDEGRPHLILGLAHDATKQRETEASLIESEEKFRQLSENIDDVFWIMDADGEKMLYVSPAYERLWGRTIEHQDLRVRDWVEGIYPDDRDRVIAAFRENALEGKYDEEYRIVRADRTIRWVRDRGFPIRDEGNRVHRVAGIAQDITERKLIESEREAILEKERLARAQAEETNRLKDEFLATLSHELRTPLTAILGWTHMLRYSQLDETTSLHAVETIDRNARTQRQLVEDVLDVSRIITGKLQIESHQIELLPVIQAAIDMIKPGANSKNQVLSFSFDPRMDRVVADPHRLQQVIWNLLSNSVKFTPPGGRISIEVVRMLSHVRIVVSDTGEGIKPEFLPHVFDRFRQADSSTTRRHGGLGLGLAIVRHIVELHGGAINAFSAGEGKGSTFTVDLPVTTQHPVQSGGFVSTGEPQREGQTSLADSKETLPALLGLRILVVEDDKDTSELLRIFLKRNGATVTIAESSAAAIDLLKKNGADVIVSDIGMADENGYEMMKKIRRLSKDEGGAAPAIALTAYANESDKMQAMAAGFQLHLAKPADPVALVAAIENLAGHMGLVSSD